MLTSKERQLAVRSLKERYPVGCRIQLDKMDDIQAPPIGTKGTVIGVDDMFQLMVRWDNGSSLSLIVGMDEWHKVQ